MNIRNLLEYAWCQVFTRQVSDYVSMGMGIEQRFQELSTWWKSHLDNSKALQREALALCVSSHKTEIAILGSGRLYDLDSSILSSQSIVHLYDYDPRSIYYCKKKFLKNPAIHLHCEDLTGAMMQWRSRLKKAVRLNIPDLEEILKNLKGAPSKISGDLVVSLNILGQLGIYWADRVEKILGQRLVSAVQEALNTSIERLEFEHVEMLASTGAKVILIITDERYHFYGEQSSCVEALMKPLDSLIAQCPEFTNLYQKYVVRRWLWHIQPWGMEDRSSSELASIHSVLGVVFVRRDGIILKTLF